MSNRRSVAAFNPPTAGSSHQDKIPYIKSSVHHPSGHESENQ